MVQNKLEISAYTYTQQHQQQEGSSQSAVQLQAKLSSVSFAYYGHAAETSKL